MTDDMMTTRRARPFGVTVLAILAGIAAVLSAYFFLQSIGLFPALIGPFAVRGFNLWYAILWALMTWIYIWLVRMLWNVEPAAWLFLVIITIWNLTIDFFLIIGSSTFSDVSVSFILNGLVLIYCMLPSVRRAFGTGDYATG